MASESFNGDWAVRPKVGIFAQSSDRRIRRFRSRLTDGHVGNARSVVFEFRRTLAGPLWSATCDDADRFLARLRRDGRAVSTRAGKAGLLAQFYDFVISRYQGDIHALTGFVVEQPIDEFNRQSGASLDKVRVPPSDAEVEELLVGGEGR